jgi:hypothetical protein
MQFYTDITLYFSVLPRDLVANHLRRFCFNYRGMRRYLTIEVPEKGNISFDAHGNLIACSFQRRCVSVYNGSTLIKRIGPLPLKVWCCVTDDNDRCYITQETKIVVGDDKHINLHGELPFGLSVSNEKLYVCTLTGVKVFDTNTCEMIEGFGDGPCRCVATSPRGLFVGFPEAVLTPTCTFPVFLPRQLAVDADDNIYVTRGVNNCVSVFTVDGEPLGTIDFKFENPFGIAISRFGVLAVSDNVGIHLFQ